ncbi:MAG: hypothetical protein WCJ29_03465 [bacterium]
MNSNNEEVKQRAARKTRGSLIRHLFVFIFLFCFASPVFAARINISVSDNQVAPGSPVIMRVLLDTQGATINAVEGELRLSGKAFAIKSVSEAHTQVTEWLDRPMAISGKDEITIPFSGLIIGGVSGKSITLFNFEVQAIAANAGSVRLVNAVGYLNDGNATPVSLTLNPVFSLDKSLESVLKQDSVAPEPFGVVLNRDLNLYNFRWYLMYSAKDRDSGVSWYEIREPDGHIYQTTELTYALHDQTTSGKIIVTAVDRYGNRREATVNFEAANNFRPIKIGAGIAIAFAVIYYLLWRAIRRKQK